MCTKLNISEVSHITEQEFEDIAYQRSGAMIKLLTPYTKARERITYQCMVCGDVREVQARHFLEGRGCVACVRRRQAENSAKTDATFRKEMAEVNPKIEILTPYERSHISVSCKCLVCGNIWSAIPHTLLAGHGCPECAHVAENWLTHDQFVDRIHSRFPTLTFTSQYQGMGKCIDVTCDVCGYEWSPNAESMTTAAYSGCPLCARRTTPPENVFLERLAQTNNKVEYIGGYRAITQKVTVKCVMCGYVWDALPSNLYKGRGCPHCKSSFGEERIATYLTTHDITYIPQHTFNDCRSERPLPFDFYVPGVNMCIEYDGQQHYMPVKFSDISDEQVDALFRSQLNRDFIKDQYCIDNDITLLRIPYTDLERIDEVLDKYLL